MKEKIEIEIKELLELLETIVKGQRFSSYHKVVKNYTSLLKILNEKENLNEDDFSIIQNCVRIFSEAFTGNYDLGLKILNKMDQISTIRDQIILEIED